MRRRVAVRVFQANERSKLWGGGGVVGLQIWLVRVTLARERLYLKRSISEINSNFGNARQKAL